MTGRELPSACVLVLNYNGRPHLEACLSTALRAAAASRARCSVVLVDNRSADDSVAYTRASFPAVEVVVARANDFLFSYNEVVRDRPEDVAILVNNDMRFDERFVAELLPHFSDPGVFAVGARILTWDGAADTVGPRCARVRHGWFYKWWALDRQETADTIDVCGGAAAYRRSTFIGLGGFDPLYRPGYYEDFDLAYRARARGWRLVYEPRSRAYHKISVSMLARHGEARQDRLHFRNHVLFQVKNVGGPGFLCAFMALLPVRALRPLLEGRTTPLRGILAALPRIPLAMARRMTAGGHA